MLKHQHNNPRSASRARPSRGLTLAEVLIAMGILTLGLLGVASVFPVGGHYMQTGDVADRSGAIAQAALQDAFVRGFLKPDNWVVHDVDVSGGDVVAYMNLLTGASATQRVGLRGAVAQTGAPIAMLGEAQPTWQSYRATRYGGAYVIDPIGVAAALSGSSARGSSTAMAYSTSAVRRFPASAGVSNATSPKWNAFESQQYLWPVRRVTVVGSLNALNGNLANGSLQQAIEAFSSRDDLAADLPSNGDEPVRMLWDNWDSTNGRPPTSRLANRDYSWIITVAFGSTTERDAIAYSPDAYPVEVSAVVFYKRPMFRARGPASALEAERLVNARVVSTGPGGGEMLLSRRTVDEEPETSPFEDLRAGQYVMVAGPHPLSTDTEPIFVVRWCRVLHIETEGSHQLNLNNPAIQLGKNGTEERVLVSLRGPDWPWYPAGDLLNDSLLSNDLRVAIVPGAVAVHTKTMRLEAGSEWSVQ